MEQTSDPLRKLSHRERQVTQRYAHGESYKAIAKALFVSPATVRSHLNKIYEKLGVHSKAELFPLLVGASAEAEGSRQRGAPAEQPSADPVNHPPLPAVHNRLIGREQELRAVTQLLLRPDVGLVTLTGPGGSGKTRLGLQVAGELPEHFRGRVHFVALAPIRNPELFASTIAKILGLQESGQRSPLESLKDYLHAKSLLLVLDNFEQILAAAPQLAELLTSSAGLKILVTSRAALRIRDEHEFPVLPLTLPRQDDTITPEMLSRYAAVELFVERALAIRPDFTVTDDNAATLAAICVRLDGLPLAIELAAARLRLLSPQAMLARLDHRLPLLTSGARDLPRRQQTLRATIAWSHDLLTVAEQRLFHYLSVFVGGCSLAAIETLCQAMEADQAVGIDILDALESPLAMNLLRRIDGVDGEPRFLMLETIREFGLEQLEARGELALLRRHHAEYFLTFVEQADAQLRGPEQGRCLDRLEAEHANIRAALKWSLEPDGDAQLGLRMGAVLGWFWRFRGYLSEGRSWSERILAASPGRTAPRSKLLARSTLLTYGQGDNMRAQMLAEESIAIARELGDDTAIGWALHAMGRVLHSSAEYEQASVVLEESLERFRAADDVVGRSYSSWILGDVKRAQGDYRQAAPLMEDGLRFAHQSGDTWALASAYLNAGGLAYRQQDFDRASALLKQSLGYYRNIRALWGVWFPISNLGAVAAARGYAKRAVCLAGAEKVLREAIGANMIPSHRADYEEGLVLVRRALNKRVFDAAWAKGEAMSTEQAIEYALSSVDEEQADHSDIGCKS